MTGECDTHEPLDGTPFQCNCYSRGEEDCIAIFAHHVNEILDGKDDGLGVNREPWGSLRQRLLKLVKKDSCNHEHDGYRQQVMWVCKHCGEYFK